MRNVDASGFEIRVQEWDYLDGIHAAETIGYLALERGNFILEGGTRLEAGIFETDRVRSFENVTFGQAFQTTPVVFASVASFNEIDAVTGRLHKISKKAFKYCMQEQELNAKTHAKESIHYIAWEPSIGEVGGLPFEVGKTGDVLEDSIQSISFKNVYNSSPVFIADIQTFNGKDTANVRSHNKNAASVDVQIDEEQSKTEETTHTTEVLGYLVFAVPELTEEPGDGGEDNNSDEEDDNGEEDNTGEENEDDGMQDNLEVVDDVKDFVSRFYQLCLDRNPDEAGLEGWASDLMNQIKTGAEVAEGFIYSTEFLAKNTTNAEFLRILYSAFFDRVADPAGRDVWMSELDNGKDRGEILDGFIYSQEFSELCSKFGIKAFENHNVKDQRAGVEAFVSRFYQLCLEREPDDAGLDAWADSLRNQTHTGADVARGFIESVEFINKPTTNGEFLSILYEAFFNREPDQAGWDVWIAELNGGKDRGYVLNGFLGSQEFIKLCEDYGIIPF